jgi:hypothetical protein
MMFLCNSCQPMHFFWYASTIGWLADPVVTLLILATADTILLFCPTSATHSRCIGDAHTILGFLLSADSSYFSYRSNMADQSLVFHPDPHTSISADLSTRKSAICLLITHPQLHPNRQHICRTYPHQHESINHILFNLIPHLWSHQPSPILVFCST